MTSEHSEPLAAYWAEALGGPTTYSDSYGDQTSVVRMHSGNGPHEEMDRRGIGSFDQGLADAGLAGEKRLRQVLHDYFASATTTTMSRYHRSADDVPDGLLIPQWSWDGLVLRPVPTTADRSAPHPDESKSPQPSRTNRLYRSRIGLQALADVGVERSMLGAMVTPCQVPVPVPVRSA
jgi:hemoglobin